VANTVTLGLHTTGSVTNTGTVNDTLLGDTVSSVLGLKETAATDTANATAQTASATGYQAEQTAYGQVGAISQNNAALAQAAGTVTAYQDLLKAKTTIGEQQQSVGAAGLRNSGSNLSLLRGSLQQSYLTQQLDETQTAIDVGGYLAEKAGASAEYSAAGAAADSATALGKSYTSAASLATTNAANETSALNTYLGSGTRTADENLLLAPLSADITQPTTILNGSTTSTGTVSTALTSSTRGKGFGPNGEPLTSIGLVGFAGGE
jgi:hypothetical protein